MKFKKLHKGMTLVEVIVAMSMFSICTTAVAIAFKAAVDYNTKNHKRDNECAIQLNELQDGTSVGVELYNGHSKDQELVFAEKGKTTILEFPKKSGGGKVQPYVGVSEYQASKSGKNDDTYDFQLKTFSTSEMGANKVQYDRASDKYKLEFINESSEPVDVYIYVTTGNFYLGDYDSSGYKHMSDLYTHSLAPTAAAEYDMKESGGASLVKHKPSQFEVGYKCANLKDLPESPMKIVFMKEGGIGITSTLTLDNSKITTMGTGFARVTIPATGAPVIDYDPS